MLHSEGLEGLMLSLQVEANMQEKRGGGGKQGWKKKEGGDRGGRKPPDVYVNWILEQML